MQTILHIWGLSRQNNNVPNSVRHLAGYVVQVTPHKIGGCQDHPGQPWWDLLSLNSPTEITGYFVPQNHQPFFISDVSDALTGHKTRTRTCQKSRHWLTLTVKSVDLIFCPDQLIPLLIPYAFNWQTSFSMRILWPHSWSFHHKPRWNKPLPQICLFDITFVIDACSLLFQPSPDVEHLNCWDSTKFWFCYPTRAFQPCLIILLNLFTLRQKSSDFNIFFCQHRKTVAWPKPRTSLITTVPPWDHFLCKIWVIIYKNDKKKSAFMWWWLWFQNFLFYEQSSWLTRWLVTWVIE